MDKQESIKMHVINGLKNKIIVTTLEFRYKKLNVTPENLIESWVIFLTSEAVSILNLTNLPLLIK